ncbi:hypothetical protein Psi02_51290 [Planotetraspora silvatica]|uniref:Peptidase S1 domain-containing protein n=1 Tax=Planotetraspora silvatica TaxID=234614 RepID=A0A8J3V2B9_9ACTN|nr:hypothetical protein [Planotetraspora silvatica]GII48705.1 hypothetical protein Psi02_51290 [Planotetraspora silvatica]
MTPSLPLLAVVTLAAGLLTPPAGQGDPVTDIVEHAVAPALGGYWTPERMARAVPIGLLPAIGDVGGAGKIGGVTRGVLPAPAGTGESPAAILPAPVETGESPAAILPAPVESLAGGLNEPGKALPTRDLAARAKELTTPEKTTRERTGPAQNPGKTLPTPGRALTGPAKKLTAPGQALTHPDLLAAGRPLPLPAKFLRDRGGLVPRRVKPGGALRRGLAVPGGAMRGNDQAARLRQSKSTRQAVAAPASTTNGSHWGSGGSVTRTTGRVFLTMKGVDFVCSASAVDSANRDVVVTAGHCVKDGAGAWAENWTFVPGYQGGRQPYGAFSARRMFVPGPWSRGGDDDYDVGMVAVTRHGARHLTDLVGGQEIGFFPKRGVRTYGFGFPADPPYDGEHLLYCAGSVHGDPQGQSQDQGLRCDLTAGASGGPWLTDFDPATGRGTLTSVSSFKYSNDRGTMYGPYFSTATQDLFRLAEGA